MHPRTPRDAWPKARRAQAAGGARLRARARRRCIRARSTRTSQHGKVRNWFGGSSQRQHAAARRACTTAACCAWRGARAASRCYAARDAHAGGRTSRARALDALVDVIVAQVRAAARGLARPAGQRACASARRSGATSCGAALRARKARLAQRAVDGIDWYWPAARTRRRGATRRDDAVRLLAPFDPVVWDRRRFELLWGWAYRFEAYTPAPQARARLLRAAAAVARPGDRLGQPGAARRPLDADIGYVAGRAPRDAAFRRALDDELERAARASSGSALSRCGCDQRARVAAAAAAPASSAPKRQHRGRARRSRAPARRGRRRPSRPGSARRSGRRRRRS